MKGAGSAAMPTPLPLVQPIESVTLTGTGSTARWESSRYLYDAQNRLSRQVEGAGSAAEHLIYLEGYEDRVGGYRTRSYVDDYAHVTRYRYGQLELRFVLTDRLGSVVGVVRADRENTSSPLTVESTLAYDVFGTPRRADSWAPLVDTESWPQATPPGQSIPTTRHGFTGHEMLSKQRLIHMRGRLFDPRMGRFTGVDPVIQFPLSTQGLNPYSYLLNNPLAGTDPTGYEMALPGREEPIDVCRRGPFSVNCGGYSAAELFLDDKNSGNGANANQSVSSPALPSDSSEIGSASTRPNLTSDEKIADLHAETFATIGNTVAMAVGNWYPDSWNGILATAEVITMQEPGTFWRFSEWVTARNEVAAERVGDVRAVIGTALTVAGVRLGLVGGGSVRAGAGRGIAKPGEFSIVDWNGYPAGVPKPQGPFRLVEGAEYGAARKAANQANNQIRQTNNLRGQPVDVHEVQPVKFGGSPTDPSNKVIIDRTLHRQEVTPWWNHLQNDLGGG